MPEFNSQTLANLKKLCRIEFTPEEETDIILSLNRVLEYVHLLNEADTSSTPSCNYVLSSMLKSVVRNDEVKDLLSRESFLANSPDQIGGLIRVPTIMKSP